MLNAADTTPADMTILADTALNAAPVFPFHVCHKNGFFVLDPPVVYDPAPLATEIVFTPPRDWWKENDKGCNTIIGAIESIGLILSPCGVLDFGGDYANSAGASVYPTGVIPGAELRFYSGTKYKLTISIPNATDMTLTIVALEASDMPKGVLPMTHNFSVPLSGNPEITFGFPTKAQLACNYDGPPCKTAEGMIIHSVSRVA